MSVISMRRNRHNFRFVLASRILAGPCRPGPERQDGQAQVKTRKLPSRQPWFPSRSRLHSVLGTVYSGSAYNLN